MTPEKKPNFERFMTTLCCEATDRVPLGGWSVHPSMMERFICRKLTSVQDQMDFRQAAGFDFVAGPRSSVFGPKPPGT
jgi:hypothetical protein